MATLPSTEVQPTAAMAEPTLICLPEMQPDAQAHLVEQIHSAFPGEFLLIAATNSSPNLLEYPSSRSQLGWVLGASDYAAAATLAQQHEAKTVLLLGPDANCLTPDAIRQLVEAIRNGADLVLPRYQLDPHEGLITSALLYPLTRALFLADILFPLPLDAAVSPRLLQRLAAIAARAMTQNSESLIWPAIEATVASYTINQIDIADRIHPAPNDTDLNTLFAAVTGSLFADIEARATFWQRATSLRAVAPSGATATLTPGMNLEEVHPMIESFRLAAANLGEIWGLVLPPQTIVALKKLARSSPEEFTLDANLWARIVYDFALSFRLRTLNRGHLLGAMTPLYLAWVASHLRMASEDPLRSAQHIEATAQAFEREKPYLVARWRWPDRFNP